MIKLNEIQATIAVGEPNPAAAATPAAEEPKADATPTTTTPAAAAVPTVIKNSGACGAWLPFILYVDLDRLHLRIVDLLTGLLNAQTGGLSEAATGAVSDATR